jgi:hypothetical protein
MMETRDKSSNLFPSLLSLLHGGTIFFFFFFFFGDRMMVPAMEKNSSLSHTTNLVTSLIDLKSSHEHLNTTYPKYLSSEFSVGHVLVGVNPCGRCTFVSPLLQIAKLPKNHGFKICEMTWVGILPFFCKRVIFCHMRWFDWRFDKKNLPQFNL